MSPLQRLTAEINAHKVLNRRREVTPCAESRSQHSEWPELLLFSLREGQESAISERLGHRSDATGAPSPAQERAAARLMSRVL